MFSRPKALLAILALACTGFLVACGDEDEGPSASAGGDAAPGNLTLVADASGTPPGSRPS